MASTHDLRAEKIFSVKDYVCVVTGGGTGIGLMATQALAANVTNAGIAGPKGIPESSNASELSSSLWSSESPPEWSSVFNTNVTSVYFTTVAFLPLLQASQASPSSSHPLQSHHPHRSPSVIVISSMSGIMRNSQGHFAYNAAKGATIHLSKLMSAEFEKANVRVNSIAPGYFPSEMTAKTRDEQSNKSELPNEKIQEKGHVPAERPGSDEEMAMAVIFLCRNMYVNGEVVAVDGGVLNQVPGR
ncbi:MAG: hypothetical protein LQ351_004823 [Letrouitia transgressa]|nr:MAG: hypothetical protein LQ351_004823 [Letrouitia transgressa]